MPDDLPAEPGDLSSHHLDVEVVGAAVLPRARAWLDAAEDAAGVPLVDEAERRRLEAGGPPPGWRAWLVRRGAEVLAYVALTAAAADHGADGREGDAQRPWSQAGGDVALAPSVAADPTAAREVLDLLRRALAGQAVAGQVWVRRADAQLRAAASAAGFRVVRRLAVLGRHLDVSEPVEPTGVRIRSFRPGADDAAVLAVLQAAYAGSADGGWRAEDLSARQAWPWFRAEDLLLAELDVEAGVPGADTADAGGGAAGDRRWVAGLHWLKRRSASVGEVYNLAVHPDAAGRGIGPLLLDAGLAHLRRIGCEQVVLWVDLANERAVALYRGRGFVVRWEDVALAWP